MFTYESFCNIFDIVESSLGFHCFWKIFIPDLLFYIYSNLWSVAYFSSFSKSVNSAILQVLLDHWFCSYFAEFCEMSDLMSFCSIFRSHRFCIGFLICSRTWSFAIIYRTPCISDYHSYTGKIPFAVYINLF